VKRKLWLLAGIVFLLLTVTTACDSWSSYLELEKYGQNDYDGELTWNQVSTSNDWVGRYKHASTVFDGSLWIFGGYGYQGISKDSYLEDVWKSTDGVTWEATTMDAPWKGRTGHAVVVLNGEMLLIGGYAVDEDGESTEDTNHYMNDVWKSTDGVNWEIVTSSADFGVRAYHGAIVVNVSGTDTIYVIGGRKNGTEYYDDIWKSEDGSTWSQVSLTDDQIEILGQRAGMAVTSVDSDIYIMGGYTADYQLSEVNENNWMKIRKFDPEVNSLVELSRPNGDYDNRALLGMVPYDNKLYLFSGVDISRMYSMDYTKLYSTWTYDYANDAWTMDSDGSGFGPRYGYTTELFDDKIWILGGWAYTGTKNDVWTAEGEV
jgi:N-acetylneuraminic acid mutarotase